MTTPTTETVAAQAISAGVLLAGELARHVAIDDLHITTQPATGRVSVLARTPDLVAVHSAPVLFGTGYVTRTALGPQWAAAIETVDVLLAGITKEHQA